jgi:hypothetical protein
MKGSQKKVLNGQFRKARPVGKPRAGWEDVVWRDKAQILGIRGWRRRAEDKRRMEASSEGGQGPEGAVTPWIEWNGRMRRFSRSSLE